MNNMRWGLVLNHSSQGHVIKPSLHGWHLSSSLHTFLAQLTVPFSSSELDVRAALWPDHTKAWGVLKMLFTACCYHGSAAPTGPWRGTIAVLGEQMIW
jgi:hypothetical protein